MIKKTKYYSYKTGKIAKGCELCTQGRKSVLFATGLCFRKCFFCPISDHKKNKDIVFINELNISELELAKLIKEINLNKSFGVGITGGDPLSKIARTVGFIKFLKEKLGKKFHIHLYTGFELVNETNLKKLYSSGLDEIRFHPKLKDKSLWTRIEFAKKFDWKIGIEVPVLPDKELLLYKMILFFKDKVDFINLNELEMSDNKNIQNFKKRYVLENNNSFAVKDSLNVGINLLEYCDTHNINAHLCSVKLKDRVQLAKRIKLRSNSAKLKTDKITSEGLLIRGVIYSNIVPGVKYEKILNGLKDSVIEKEIEELKKLKSYINKKFKLPLTKLFIDFDKLRILTTTKIAKKLSKKIPEQCAIVTEYPTADQLTIEIDLLKK